MISSPPQEAEQIRGKTLTPESPKPLHYPSPSNIPILEKQNDPMFNEPPLNIGTPALFQSYPQQTQTPGAHSNTPYYSEQHQPQQQQQHQQQQQGSAPSYQHSGAQGAVALAPAPYSPSTAYGSGQAQDTSSNHNFTSQHQAPTQFFSETTSAPVQDHRPAYPSSYDSILFSAHQTQAQPAQGNQYSAYSNADSGVNYQALLDSLSPPTPANSGSADRYAAPMPAQPTQPQGQTQIPASTLPAAPNLPARPPAQEKPATHPNYNPHDDIRSYHPHSQKSSNAQSRGTNQLQPLNTRGGGNPSMDHLSSARSNPSPSTPVYGRRQSPEPRSESPDDEDARWPPEINRLYEEFLEDERKFVTDGQWDQFPMGSRLFIGNLPTEKVTKRDIFHRFFRHGKLAQISIKQAYGFVQFLDTSSCYKALHAEQGQAVRGRKMHLEISKPQRNTKKAGEGNNHEKITNARRRSRSPDYTRGGLVFQPKNDRYAGIQAAISPRDRENRRFRDDYRPMRSPSPSRSPPRGGRNGRGRDRSRDRYEARRRSRSRSSRRYRSLSPRPDLEDELPLPHRVPAQVPDVQVLVVNEGLPRDFIHWVEDIFRQQSLRIDVLILSPRLSEAAVIRRQIVEGVLAIVKLNAASVAKSKIDLQVFDRRGGNGNVQFNEYADLDPSTAAALVNNAKVTHSQAAQPLAQTPATYGYNYSIPPIAGASYVNAVPPNNPYAPAPANPPAQDLSSLISSLDSHSLSQLLGAMGQGQSTVAQSPQPLSAGITADLARLLGSVSTPAQAPTYAVTPQQTYHNPYQTASLASLLGGQSQQPPQAAPPAPPPAQHSQPDMNEIMAQLANYQR